MQPGESSDVICRMVADDRKAEFLYKVKPKLPAQFKAAEQNGVPFALILGDVSRTPVYPRHTDIVPSY